jgi:LuxR family maltose regulon positive regulatory protein
MGIVQYHSGQLDLAEKYIETGLEQVVRHGEMFSIVEGFAALILVQIAKGDQDQARSLQKELYQVVGEIPSNQNSLAILKVWDARINLLLGDFDQAARILEKMTFESIHERYMFEIASYSYVGIYRVSQTPVRVYLDFLELTKARVMLHQKKFDTGLQLINNILKRIDEGGNCRYQIEALIVKSLLVWNKGEIDQSEQIFQDAVKLASKEGFIQVFLNEGDSIYPLLESVKEKITGDIEQKIFVLKLSEQLQDRIKNQQATRDDQLVRLTPREVEVLSCLASGISYAQAADELSISRNTIKTHTKRIYQKLGVNGLLQAVNRANQLGLL